MRLTAFENPSFYWRHHTCTIKAGTLCQRNNKKKTCVKSYFEGQLSTEQPSPIQRHLSKVASNRILTTCFSPSPSTGKGKGRAQRHLSQVTCRLTFFSTGCQVLHWYRTLLISSFDIDIHSSWVTACFLQPYLPYSALYYRVKQSNYKRSKVSDWK